MSSNYNTHAGLFIAAALRWFQDDPGRIIQRLDEAFRAGNQGRTIEFRTDVVTDFRGHTVPASAERLIRWDYRHPNVIFRYGFVPQYDAGPGDPLANQHVDLEQYVNNNVQSIFVGTARCYRQNDRVARWTPRGLANRFEYEIFAFGGIDVNLSLGYNHRYFNQREIAFPGGIRTEFIRTAREYDNNGRIVRIWVNPLFDVTANGRDHSSRLWQLPDPTCGPQVPVIYWSGDEPDDQPGPSHRELRDTSSQQDAMREPGDLEPDDMMDNGCPVLPVKFITGDDAPEEGHEYAISLVGTTKVLACINGTELSVDHWHGEPAQRFRCVTKEGYMGFICSGAGGSGRYLGYNAHEVLACQAYYQRKWEHIFPRADPAGGFMLWMFKDDNLAPVMQVGRTEFKMMASSTTRFSFTKLDGPVGPGAPPPDFWGVYPAGTDSPAEGHVYAIKIYGTSKAFTCVDGTEMRLRDWMNYKTQRFRCTTYAGYMGFICEGADGGKGRYLGFDGSETLSCQGYYQKSWEHIHAQADPQGGFKLWMKKDDRLAPVAQVNEDTLKMMATSSTRVSFTKIE
ncbi:hypothetical protein TWF696_000186 [Orbilia brochopaga]|uniref:Pierisin-like domain-containing protein n=1 Tax=Orbilia brochopaga TaxID=3140254 RepID=A0AAV9VCW2_9PEZI